MSRFLCALILCAALTPCASSQPSTTTAEVEVQQASDRFWATRERGDAAALVAQFTENAILMIPGLPDTAGRSAIRKLTEKRFAAAKTTDFKVQRREIQVMGGSAYELGWYSEIHRGEDEPMRLQARYLIVWKREGDRVWRVHRNLYNLSAAEPVP